MNQANPPRSEGSPSVQTLWLPALGAIVVFTGHLLYGAVLRQTSLSFVIAYAVLLAVCLVVPATRADFLRFKGLRAPAILFAATVAVALWSLTPFVPGGPHPVWAYTGVSPGAATIDKSATLLEIIKLLGLACIFLVGAITGASDQRARTAMNTLLGVGAAYALWVFFQHLSLTPGERLAGSFQMANPSGTLFAALLLLAVGTATSRLSATTRRNRLTLGVALPVSAALIFVVCLLMTASRGAFLATGVALIVFGALEFFGGRVKLSRAALIGLGSLTVVGLFLFFAGDRILDRFVTSGTADVGREQMMQVHWRAFLTSPLMGYGLGAFDTINRTLLDSQNFTNLWKIRAVHNVYLTWLEQAGLIGAAPMFALIGLLIFVTTRNALGRTRLTHALFALIAVDVVFLVHGFTDFTLEVYSMAAMWAYVLGLQLSLSYGSRNR